MIPAKKKLTVILMTAILVVLMVSCSDKKYQREEKAQIDKYLADHPDQAFEQKSSGLYYLDLVIGTGAQPQTGDTAYVKYTGKFLNGNTFDSNVSKADSLIFAVNDAWLIQGIDEGINYMKVGGKALMLIPSKLAYGSMGTYGISGYTPLLFEISLLKVKPGPGK